MPHSIIIHQTYSTVIIALAKETTIIAQTIIDSKNISKLCMLTIDALLSQQNLTLADIQYIGINNGPGPFSALRSIIASANGLYFVTNIPLVGVDGLTSLYYECAQQSKTQVVALLNAYSQDVFFYFEHDGYQEFGYKNIDVLLIQLAEIYQNQTITFVGNGSTLYADAIKAIFGSQAIIDQHKEHASIERIAYYSYGQWKQLEWDQSEEENTLYISARYIKVNRFNM